MKYLFICIIFLLTCISFNAQEPILYDPVVTQLDQGFQLAEGPIWVDNKLLFSDVYANTIYQWTEEEGTASFLNPSGNSNGLALDNYGRLLIAQHGKRQVAVLLENNTDSMLVGEYGGKKLNSPNDIAVRSDGAFYFTDPPYGIDPEEAELSFSGIYLYTNINELILLDSTVYRPNGIVLSPDESMLYVSDSEYGYIYSWEIVEDTIRNKTLFANVGPEGSGWSDGMAVDENGFLYATGPSGIWVFHPNGTYIRTISVSPGYVSNCGWGADDDTTLYVTAWQYLYKITNKEPATFIKDIPFSDKIYISYYPNPTDNILNIEISNTGSQGIEIDILDITGEAFYQKEYGDIDAYFTEQIDLSGYAKGIYLVKVRQVDTVYLGKVVVR